jgi:hypothetical protein
MSSVPFYKVCPSCRAEHTHVTLRCADCGVELVHPDALGPEPTPTELPAASELDCIRVAPVEWIRVLSDGLGRAGISHRIEPATAADAPEGQSCEIFEDAQLFGLYVEPASGASARELDEEIASMVFPDEAPALPDGELDACPACGAALESDATECPDCELVFA